jgi:hypothetical protein
MEENKVQAFHDELTLLADKRGKTGGLGLGGGSYSWSVSNVTTERTDGLPNNPLYVNFVREGSFDTAKPNHGDGRMIKRNFDDCKEITENISSNGSRCSVVSEDVSKRVKLTKEEKKAAKLEAKRQAKIAEKKAARLLEKKAKRQIEKLEQNAADSDVKNQANEILVAQQCEKPKKSKDKAVKKLKKSKKEKLSNEDCEEGTKASHRMASKQKEINETPNTIIPRMKKEKRIKEEDFEKVEVGQQLKKKKKKKTKD